MGGSKFDGGREGGWTKREKLEKQSSQQLHELTCAHKACCQKLMVGDKQSLQILCTAEIGQKKS